MGLQFLFTGLAKKMMHQSLMQGTAWCSSKSAVEGAPLTQINDCGILQADGVLQDHLPVPQLVSSDVTDLVAAVLGGAFASLFASPVELVMIQQQRYGGAFLTTPYRIALTHGVLGKGLMRGLCASAGRDSFYACGLLGITPLLQSYLMKEHGFSTSHAGFHASMVGGLLATLPSQPFDVIKSCMQGDLSQSRYGSFSATVRQLYVNEGGWRRLYSGCFWRTVNITLTIYIANECRVRFMPAFRELPL